MYHLAPDTILSPRSINSATYSKLITLLTKNETWKKLAEAFGIFSVSDLQNLSWSRKPAEALILELEARLCNVELFCDVLQGCNMYDILMLFKKHEPLCIIQQPNNGYEDKMVLRGTQLNLMCKATGLPFPCYQWYCDNKELDTYADSVLCINKFRLEDEGEYYCIVSQDGYNSLCSNSVNVTLAPEIPVIIKEPAPSTICKIGSRVELNVIAEGHPDLKYQWYKGNELLNGASGPKLTFTIEDESQEGIYRCYIHNVAGEVWSGESKVTLYSSPRPEPSVKIAILIANQLYDNMNRLSTPENDAKTLADILKNLGFYVVALQNLSLVEMRNAINYVADILPQNAYVVFYFSGHGFEISDKFMLPVDAPGPEDYLQTHALCEKELLRAILNSKPMLFLELLDMCLKPPDPLNKKIFEEKTSHYEYIASNNLIQGYATTSCLGAYEKISNENGLYVEHLKEYLTKKSDMPIVEILGNVAKDFAKVCPRQKPFFGTNVTMDYRLTDPCSDNTEIRKKIESLSVLPKDMTLVFDKVKVSSRVHFSSFLEVFLNTIEVHFSGLQDFRVSCETHGEELSFELIRINGDVSLKVMNIQRLVSSKALTLWLLGNNGQYLDCAMFDIGKPLIASVDLWWKK